MIEKECVHLINRTWQASDGCGNVVYLNQVIRSKRPRLLVHFPLHVPNVCVGGIGLRTTGRPEIESPCQQERVRIAYRDNISKKDCQEKGLLLERHFTVTKVCGREYTGVQRIYPGKASLGRCMGREQGEGIGAGKRGGSGVWEKDRYRGVCARGRGLEGAGKSDRYRWGNRCIEEAMVWLGVGLRGKYI